MHIYSVKTILVLMALGLLVFAGVGRARADAAPPAQAPGSGIGQDGQTKVQMMSERVEFDTYSLESTKDDTDEPYVAVTAYFVMRNQGQVTEQLATRFPMNSGIDKLQAASDLQDFSAYVGGQLVDTKIVQEPSTDCTFVNCPLVPWATFNVTYPIGQDVVIKVAYHLVPVDSSDAYGTFDYTLVSGAGWYGPIGTADFILRLPYIANSENARGGYRLSTEPFNPTYVADEVHWHVTNLEPTTANNLSFSVFYPERWRTILKAQAETNSEPEDFQGFLDLGDAYFEAAPLYHGFNYHLLEPALRAYNEALRLQPNSVKANLSVALMMWYLDGGDAPLCPENVNMTPILKRLSVAYALDRRGTSTLHTIGTILNCSNVDATSLPTFLPTLDAQSRLLVSMTPSSTLTPTPSLTPTIKPSVTLTNTATSTKMPTATATVVPSATATASPTMAPTATATPASQSQNSFDIPSLLVGVFVGVVAIVAVLAIRRRLNK